MRRNLMIMVAAASAVACGTPGAYAGAGAARPAAAPAAGGTWGAAKVVPGIAALNKGDDAGTTSVSRPSARNCEVAGTYKTSVRKKIATRPFVENETGSTWG